MASKPCGANIDKGGALLVCMLNHGHGSAHNTAKDGSGDTFEQLEATPERRANMMTGGVLNLIQLLFLCEWFDEAQHLEDDPPIPGTEEGTIRLELIANGLDIAATRDETAEPAKWSESYARCCGAARDAAAKLAWGDNWAEHMAMVRRDRREASGLT